MTAQTVQGRGVLVSARRSALRQRRTMWLFVTLVVLMIAAASALYVAAHQGSSVATSHVVKQEPNANTREGRLAASAVNEPNANTREGRLAASAVNEPNSNAREGRVPVNP
jgi:uncharacterized membrane protein